MKAGPKLSLLFLSMSFLLLYGCGLFLAEDFWGFHYAAFLPGLYGGLCWVTAVLLALGGIFLPDSPSWQRFSPSFSPWVSYLLMGLAFLLTISLFYAFPIYADFYGDARFIRQQINQTIDFWDARLWRDLLRMDLSNPKFGTDSVYALVNLFTYLLGENGTIALRWIDAVSGGLFVLLWLQLVRTSVQQSGLKILLLLMGVTAPFLLIFMGHLEVYAPSLVWMMSFWLALLTYFRTRRKGYYWLLWPLFLLNLKFHVTAALLFPALTLTTLFFLQTRFPILERCFQASWLAKWVLTPILGLGFLLYFPVTESHFGPRSYTEKNLTEALFLPLLTPEGPPLDRYNLLSPAHLFDYGNLLSLWSAPAWFLLLTIVLLYRKQIDWQQPVLLIVGLTLLLYLLAFFVLNPLLSMPTDWDLFSLPAPLLLVFVLLLAAPLQYSSLSRKVGGGMMALMLLSLPVFFVNANPASLSRRLESMGIRIFETYWMGASTPILGGIALEPDPVFQQTRRLAVLEKLQPLAVPGHDIEYADLLCETGRAYFQEKAYEKAQPYFQEAFSYSPQLIRNAYYLVVNHFYLGQYQEAHQYLPRLVAYRYPDETKALSIAVHVSLEAEQYPDAAKYAEALLQVSPDNQTMQQVRDRIGRGDNIGGIKYLFRQE